MRLLSFVMLGIAVFSVGCGSKSSSNETGGDTPKTIEAGISIECDIKGGASAVAISDDGSLAIAHGYGESKNVQIWDVRQQKKRQEFDNPSGSVLPAALSPDGKLAAYSTTFGAVMVHEVATGKPLPRLLSKDGPLGFSRGLRFSADGQLLYVAAGKVVLGWNPTTGEQRFRWQGDEKEVTALSNIFDAGKKIATANESGLIKIWEVPSGKLLQTLNGPAQKIVSLSATLDGKILAAGAVFNSIQIWDLASAKVSRSISGMSAWSSVLLHPDGQSLSYADKNYGIVMENVSTGAKRYVLRGHSKTVWSLAITPDGGTLVSGSEDKTMKIWDLKSLP